MGLETRLQLNPLTSKKGLKVTVISDTHNITDNLFLEPGDLLIHCGDFTHHGTEEEIIKFNNFLGKQPFKYKIVIAGNHDLQYLTNRIPFMNNSKDLKSLLNNAVYLENSGVSIHGWKFWGTPYFKTAKGSKLYGIKSQLLEGLKMIPKNTNVLLTHGPPYKVLDKCDLGQNLGCKELRDVVFNKIQPHMHFFGHIHESYGSQIINNTLFCNASICSSAFQPNNIPTIFELDEVNFEPSRNFPLL